MRFIWLSVVSLVAGCASIRPDALRIEISHQSHLTQHEPFTDHPTNYGADSVSGLLKWQSGRFDLQVGEGYSFGGDGGCGNRCPREIFTATFGYEIKLH